MQTTTTLTAFMALLSGCYSTGEISPDAIDYAQDESELKAGDCAGLPAPFSEDGCPKPDDLTDDAARTSKCETVKGVALNDYKNQIGREPNCSGGWVFGPNEALKSCIKDSEKNVCKLAAKNPPKGKPGWPASKTWSQCLNDWVVYCTDKFPAAMGIQDKGTVCFHPDLDYDKLPAASVTGREVCQRMTDGAFPAKCDKDFCKKPEPKPKAKAGTKKGGKGSCSSSPDAAAFAEKATRCEESWTCEACDPESDPDCAYDTACGCETCEPDDEDPACTEDLACPSTAVTEAMSAEWSLQ